MGIETPKAAVQPWARKEKDGTKAKISTETPKAAALPWELPMADVAVTC
jgi:hypothetical protein